MNTETQIEFIAQVIVNQARHIDRDNPTPHIEPLYQEMNRAFQELPNKENLQLATKTRAGMHVKYTENLAIFYDNEQAVLSNKYWS